MNLQREWVNTDCANYLEATKQNYNHHIVVLYCTIMEGFSSILNLRRHADYPHFRKTGPFRVQAVFEKLYSPWVAFLQSASRWSWATVSAHLVPLLTRAPRARRSLYQPKSTRSRAGQTDDQNRTGGSKSLVMVVNKDRRQSNTYQRRNSECREQTVSKHSRFVQRRQITVINTQEQSPKLESAAGPQTDCQWH